MKLQGKMTPLILWITVVWFAVVLFAGATGLFAIEGPPATLGFAVAAPPLVVVGLLAWSPRFRTWARSLDLRLLTALHMWRLVGFAFIAVWAVGELPAAFALPAGLGDILVALVAPLVAVYCVGRNGATNSMFYVWTTVGIVDLISAVTFGVLHSPTALGVLAEANSDTAALSNLPMSLIPTFAVPALLALHAISLFNARNANRTADTLVAGYRRA